MASALRHGKARLPGAATTGMIRGWRRTPTARENPMADGHPPDDQHARHNLFCYVGSHTLTKFGDALVDPKTTLTWLAGALGVPGSLAAMLVPLRESGSMLLQVAGAGLVQRFARRKWAWVLGAVLQALALCGMAGVALLCRGRAAGVGLLLALACFALARSLSSIASKDVLGRILPAGRRGRANGWASSAAGVAGLALGAALLAIGPPQLSPAGYALALGLGAALWLAAAALFAAVREPRAAAGESNTASRLRALVSEPVLRRFVAVRALLACTALAAPYFVMLAQRELGDSPRVLGAFIVAQGLASMLGGPLWGRLADRSSRTLMRLGGALGGVLGALLVAALWAWPAVLAQAWLLPLLYALLALSHQAVRIARKTYVVDVADDAQRADYVAASNTAIGVLLLVIGAGAAALWAVSPIAVMAAFALMGLAGAWAGRGLPEA